jgi:hypothetical protein
VADEPAAGLTGQGSPPKEADDVRPPDLTVLAIPAFFGAIAAEILWQRRNPAPPGTARAGDYELADTIASLTMGWPRTRWRSWALGPPFRDLRT